MIPSVFISSTIADLLHLRAAVGDTIRELGLIPVMSEYGGVGFLPGETAETSCYAEVAQCQLAVVIVGKRYGSVAANGLSVTHNEFRSAFDARIPILVLVDAEVLSFSTIHAANAGKPGLNYPGLENPDKTFAFVAEIAQNPRNNAILQFSTVSDARGHIRAQLAHLFGDLLKRHVDPIQADLRDVLAEVKTLRHSLVKEPANRAHSLVQGLRLLLDDEFKSYRDILERLKGGLEEHLDDVLAAKSFEGAITQATGHAPVLVEVPNDPDGHQRFFESYNGGVQTMVSQAVRGAGGDHSVVNFGVGKDGRVFADTGGLATLEELHMNLLKALESPQDWKAARNAGRRRSQFWPARRQDEDKHS